MEWMEEIKKRVEAEHTGASSSSSGTVKNEIEWNQFSFSAFRVIRSCCFNSSIIFFLPFFLAVALQFNPECPRSQKTRNRGLYRWKHWIALDSVICCLLKLNDVTRECSQFFFHDVHCRRAISDEPSTENIPVNTRNENSIATCNWITFRSWRRFFSSPPLPLLVPTATTYRRLDRVT